MNNFDELEDDNSIPEELEQNDKILKDELFYSRIRQFAKEQQLFINLEKQQELDNTQEMLNRAEDFLELEEKGIFIANLLLIDQFLTSYGRYELVFDRRNFRKYKTDIFQGDSVGIIESGTKM